MCCKERLPLLLKYFITFFRRIHLVGGASISIYKTLMVHIMFFLLKITLKCHAKCKISGTLSAQKRGYCPASRDRYCCLSISNLPQIYNNDYMNQAIQQQHRISGHCKISNFGHPPSTGNVMLRCKEIHPLLLGCFITFFRCIGRFTQDSDSIYQHHMVKYVSFLPKTTLNFHAKYQNQGTLSALKM